MTAERHCVFNKSSYQRGATAENSFFTQQRAKEHGFDKDSNVVGCEECCAVGIVLRLQKLLRKFRESCGVVVRKKEGKLR